MSFSLASVHTHKRKERKGEKEEETLTGLLALSSSPWVGTGHGGGRPSTRKLVLTWNSPAGHQNHKKNV